MQKYSLLKNSRLYCPIQTYKDELFLSLMDYRNSRYTSENPDKIIEFYDSFRNRDDLIEWMKERPKGVAYIHEVDGDKNIIVVIPTSDFNEKYARECRENIFKGLHMIFVESGGRGDFYFNIAHNINIGIKKAMEYDPKWVVVSNDDMYKIDGTDTLSQQLKSIENEATDVVFTQPSSYHSIPDNLGSSNILWRMALQFSKYRRAQLRLERKFRVALFPSPIKSWKRFVFKCGYRYISLADFGIFSINCLKSVNGALFNEDYINSAEDNDLSLRISLIRNRYTFINYKIGDYMGMSQGKDSKRALRSLAGMVLLNYLIETDKHPASLEIKKYLK